MILYSYARSSAAYRVRIALNLKGLAYETAPIHLGQDAHQTDEYLAINPQGMVPALSVGDDLLAQSLAIIEYLEETHPKPPLLPSDPLERAQVRRMALMIAADIHPLQNRRVIQRVTQSLGEAGAGAWAKHWIEEGFRALECIAAESGKFCFGNSPTMADVCLVPQMANARRFKVDLANFPRLAAIESHCRDLPAFAAAAPQRQPDFEP